MCDHGLSAFKVLSKIVPTLCGYPVSLGTYRKELSLSTLLMLKVIPCIGSSLT